MRKLFLGLTLFLALGQYIFGATIQVSPVLPPDRPGVVVATEASQVIVVPKAGTTLTMLDAVPPPGMTVCTFSAPVGRYTLVALVIRDNRVVDQVEAVVTVGEPEPGPEPKPPPGPTPPVERLKVRVIEENQSPDRAKYYAVLHSPKVRKWLEDNGHAIEWRDKDEVDPVPDGGSVPCVYFYDGSGQDLWKGLPVDEDAFLKLVQKWGRAKP